MTTSSYRPTTTSARPVLADLFGSSRIRELALVAGFIAALAISAQVAIPLPFTPVPVTGQTFVVLVGAAALGSMRAGFGSAVYVGLGLAGVPWFAVSGGGDGGYLFGFVLASVLVGALARRGWDRTVAGTAVIMLLGNLVIYALGVIVLAAVLHMSVAAAIPLGVTPFIPGDLVKIVLAVVVLPIAWKLKGEDHHTS